MTIIGRDGLLRNGIVFLLLLLLSSCATISNGKKATEEGLLMAATKFNDALRWEDHMQAALWVPKPMQDDFWRQMDGLKDTVRIMEYEVRRVQMDPIASTGELNLHYRYFRMNDPKVRNATLLQRWQYQAEGNIWQVVKPGVEVLLP